MNQKTTSPRVLPGPTIAPAGVPHTTLDSALQEIPFRSRAHPHATWHLAAPSSATADSTLPQRSPILASVMAMPVSGMAATTMHRSRCTRAWTWCFANLQPANPASASALSPPSVDRADRVERVKSSPSQVQVKAKSRPSPVWTGLDWTQDWKSACSHPCAVTSAKPPPTTLTSWGRAGEAWRRGVLVSSCCSGSRSPTTHPPPTTQVCTYVPGVAAP